MKIIQPILATAVVAGAALGSWAIFGAATAQEASNPSSQPSTSATSTTSEGFETAIFAGGCFWCVESDFDHVPGVIETTSGYTGGSLENPTYREVSAKNTGHREAVEITYDPALVSYQSLVHTFLRTVDAVDNGGQFCDRGFVYSPAIYVIDEQQADIANSEILTANLSGKLPTDITLPVIEAGAFYDAEGYHQNYHNKNPIRYRFYRTSCGRDRRVTALWGDEARAGVEK